MAVDLVQIWLSSSDIDFNPWIAVRMLGGKQDLWTSSLSYKNAFSQQKIAANKYHKILLFVVSFSGSEETVFLWYRQGDARPLWSC